MLPFYEFDMFVIKPGQLIDNIYDQADIWSIGSIDIISKRKNVTD